MYVRVKRADPGTGRARYEAVESVRTPKGPRQRVLATWSGGWLADGTPVPEGPLAALAATTRALNDQVALLRREQARRVGMWAARDGRGQPGMTRVRDERIARQIDHWEARIAHLDQIADRLHADPGTAR